MKKVVKRAQGGTNQGFQTWKVDCVEVVPKRPKLNVRHIVIMCSWAWRWALHLRERRNRGGRPSFLAVSAIPLQKNWSQLDLPAGLEHALRGLSNLNNHARVIILLLLQIKDSKRTLYAWWAVFQSWMFVVWFPFPSPLEAFQDPVFVFIMFNIVFLKIISGKRTRNSHGGGARNRNETKDVNKAGNKVPRPILPSFPPDLNACILGSYWRTAAGEKSSDGGSSGPSGTFCWIFLCFCSQPLLFPSKFLSHHLNLILIIYN